jgi:hypothetical protein
LHPDQQYRRYSPKHYYVSTLQNDRQLCVFYNGWIPETADRKLLGQETGYCCLVSVCGRFTFISQFSSLSVSFFVNQKLPTVFFCLATHVPFRVFHHVLTSTSWNEGSKTCDRSVFCRLDIVYAEYNREYSANQTDGPVTS